MRQVLILQGVQGSGKSTYRQQLMLAEPERWMVINWDQLRLLFPRLRNGFHRESEEKMKEHSYQLAKNYLAAGKDVIIDNTNLSEKALNRWKTLATEAGAHWAVQSFLNVPIEECIRRDAQREGKARVGRAVIERTALFNGLIEFPVTKRLVLVDMDGTLANCEHRRHYVAQKPKNWMGFYRECDLDPADPMVLEVVKEFCTDPERIVCIVSGRPLDLCGDKTVDWLERHDVKYDHLFMRNSGDGRQDFIIKEEILSHLPKERIELVLDDRNQVVNMWRGHGLRVWQVAAGDF